MSVIDAFNNSDRPSGRVLDWIAHRMGSILAVTTLAGAVATWVENSWVSVTLAGLVTAAFTVGTVVSVLHMELTRICAACMRAVPADAPVRAQRRRWLLRVAHVGSGRSGLHLFAVIAVSTLAAVLAGIRGRYVTVPMAFWPLLVSYAGLIHHRLRPWCPYCPRWDDGGDLQEPSPDPSDRIALTR
ncbi:hypothetical protein JMUB6875_42400 [Nocardia sp. JMUB6875]|uniref:hypothetical protein n=1 Tax=Nocardia sp. JMUB6875 TaxID=3158170 RepID=UPI0032E54B81